MIYASVCDGIGAVHAAWQPLGWTCAWHAEIDPFPAAVVAHRWGERAGPNLGDITKITDEEFARHGPIDLLAGGTPCQAFSVAGLRKGLADPRGNLCLTFLGLAERTRARWVVWENVPGVLSSNGGRDFGAFLGALAELGYGFAYRVLDAQYVRVDSHLRAVPQRRRRVFVVGCLGDWRRAAAVLLEPASMLGNSPPRRAPGTSVAALTARGVGTCGADDNQAQAGHLIPEVAGTLDSNHGNIRTDAAWTGRLIPDVAPCLRSNSYNNSDATMEAQMLVTEFVAIQDGRGIDKAQNGRGVNENGAAFTIDTTGAQAVAFHATQDPISSSERAPALGAKAYVGVVQSPVVFLHCNKGRPDGRNSAHEPLVTLEEIVPTLTTSGHAESAAFDGLVVRRLLPLECERLQGFPDGWTDIPWRGKPAPDGPRYKALGNSMAVNVMSWLGSRLDAAVADEGRPDRPQHRPPSRPSNHRPHLHGARLMDHDQNHPFDLPRDRLQRERLRWARYREYGPRALSASSLSQFMDCNRKWWFKKVERLKEEMSPAAAFGVVLHAVLERYLTAGDSGRSEEESAALLFPHGWEVAPKLGAIPEGEQQRIRGLVRKAIEDGVITRRPSREIEAEFWWPAEPEGRMLVHGYLDHVIPDERAIEDHKTSKSTRYLLTAKKLREDTQMLVYGEMLRLRLDGWDARASADPREQDPATLITFAHNQFITNPEKPGVRKVSCQVTPVEVAAHYAGTVRRSAEEMHRLLETASHWRDVPEAKDSSACHAYGGCPFLKMCFGDQTTDQYREAFDRREARRNGMPLPEPPATQKESVPMPSALDRLAALTGGATKPAPAPEPQPESKSQPAAQTPAEPEPQPEPAPAPKRSAKKTEKPKATSAVGEPFDKPAAPWASLACAGCRMDSVSIAGMKADMSGTCAVCRVRNTKDGKPTDRDFFVTTTEEGISWEAKAACVASVEEACGEDALAGSLSITIAETKEHDDVAPTETAPEQPEQLEQPADEPVVRIFGDPEAYCKGLTEALLKTAFGDVVTVKPDGQIWGPRPLVVPVQSWAKKFKEDVLKSKWEELQSKAPLPADIEVLDDRKVERNKKSSAAEAGASGTLSPGTESDAEAPPDAPTSAATDEDAAAGSEPRAGSELDPADARFAALEVVSIDIKDVRVPRVLEGLQKGPGRRKATFTIYFGCAPFEGVSKVVHAERLLDRIGAEIAKQAGAKDYYALPAAERRDCLALALQGMLDDLKGSHVIVPGGWSEDADLARLSAVLRAQATGIVCSFSV